MINFFIKLSGLKKTAHYSDGIFCVYHIENITRCNKKST